LKKYLKDYAFLFSVSGLIILLDQLSKYLIRQNLAFGEIWPQGHWITPFARLVNWQNTGAAFGMLPQFSLVFTILPFIVSGVIIYYFPRIPRSDWVLRLALSLQLGGAVGNLIDRLTYGYVTDFISLHRFAVFNVADAAISIGTALLAVTLLYREWQEKKDSDDERRNEILNEVSSQNTIKDSKGE
jgi:signal peptidase II